MESHYHSWYPTSKGFKCSYQNEHGAICKVFAGFNSIADYLTDERFGVGQSTIGRYVHSTDILDWNGKSLV